MIKTITTNTLWKDLPLLTPPNANMVFDTLTMVTIFNLMPLTKGALSLFPKVFKHLVGTKQPD